MATRLSPRDPPRQHFLDAQRRHRRTSALSAALVVVALALSGIPLSVLVSPILVAVAAVPVRLVDLVASVPPDLTAWVDRAFHLLPTVWSAVRQPDERSPPPPAGSASRRSSSPRCCR